MSYGAGAAARDAAERSRNVPIILRYLLRHSSALRTQLLDDLATLCSSRRLAENALNWALEPKQDLVCVVGAIGARSLYGLTDAGRVMAEAKRAA